MSRRLARVTEMEHLPRMRLRLSVAGRMDTKPKHRFGRRHVGKWVLTSILPIVADAAG